MIIIADNMKCMFAHMLVGDVIEDEKMVTALG